MTDSRYPTVTGPVTGGRGVPFFRPSVDLAAYNYIEEEYFLEGVADRYRPVAGTELGRDGRWSVEPVESAKYKTRIVVYRPADPEGFGGTVHVCWTNVSGRSDNINGLTEEMLASGCAVVGVSAQRVGVHGVPPDPIGLLDWDPDRYGSLFISSDDYSFDIFTQAARVIGPDRAGPIDPMGGLRVKKLVANGSSQSAGRLITYINAVHPLADVYHGFLLQLHFGAGAPLEVGEEIAILSTDNPQPVPGPNSAVHMVREDLNVPVMILNSELEALACRTVRQPDTDKFRWWEVAGTTHVSAQ